MVLGVRDTSLGRYTLVAPLKSIFCNFFSCQYFTDEHFSSSFIPAVNNFTNELLETEKSSRRLERELRALRRRLGATLVLQSNLQE